MPTLKKHGLTFKYASLQGSIYYMYVFTILLFHLQVFIKCLISGGYTFEI